MQKIFISHYHTDAPALSKCKKELRKAGFEAFLAHEDIKPGQHDLDTIEQELKNCDVFLYICSKQANESSFCQQEIGFARGLKKQIFTVKTDNEVNPQGFITHINAIKSKNLENLHDSLFGRLPKSEEVGKHLQTIGCKGFSLSKKENFIYLEPNHEWNDYGFYTQFKMHLNESYIGHINMGYKGQTEDIHTSIELPSSFYSLSDHFFSKITFSEDDNYAPEKKESLRYLLNDAAILPKEKLQEIKNKEPVFEKSIFRDREAEMQELLED